MQNELKEYSLFYITAPDGKHSKRIAQEILEKKLAACVNILPAVDSYFWWNDDVDHEQECLLIGKTETRCAEAILEMVPKIHPYEVCEIIFVPIKQGNHPYLDWISSSIRKTT